MAKRKTADAVSRRRFLATTGTLVASGPVVRKGAARARVEASEAPVGPPAVPKPPRAIPIGVFDSAFDSLSLEEMLDNFVVYNPYTLMRLREAAGEEIGANCDLSHVFWRGCDPIATIRFLGGHRASITPT